MTHIDVITPFDTAMELLRDLLHPFQLRLLINEERFTWNCWSRQTGKSFASTLRRLVRGGLMRRRNQILLSAGQRQSNELMAKVRQHIDAIRVATTYSEQELFLDDNSRVTQQEILLPTGARIIALPANPYTARGFTGDVLLDEFAMHQKDRDIWAALFPTVMRGDGELDIMSTPKGKANMFAALRDNDAFASTTLTIHDAVADGLEIDIHKLRAACGDELIWRQEFLCEFLDEGHAYIPWEMILACAEDGLPSLLDAAAVHEAAGSVYLGYDVARTGDLSVIWAFEMRHDVLVSLGLIEMRGVSFADQRTVLFDLLTSTKVRRCAIDSTGLGMQIAEEAVARFGDWKVEACPFTAAFKEAAAGEMRKRCDLRTIRVPMDSAILRDITSVARTVTAAGNVRLSAPREQGSHADRFWAAALACHAASDAVGPVECASGGESRSRELLPAGARGRAW